MIAQVRYCLKLSEAVKHKTPASPRGGTLPLNSSLAKRSPLPIDLEQGEIPTGREKAHFVRGLSREGSCSQS